MNTEFEKLVAYSKTDKQKLLDHQVFESNYNEVKNMLEFKREKILELIARERKS